MKFRVLGFMAAVLFATCTYPVLGHSADNLENKVKSVVDMAILPVMKKSGMGVQLTFIVETARSRFSLAAVPGKRGVRLRE